MKNRVDITWNLSVNFHVVISIKLDNKDAELHIQPATTCLESTVMNRQIDKPHRKFNWQLTCAEWHTCQYKWEK